MGADYDCEGPDSGGIFWTTFNPEDGGSFLSTPFDRLLQSPDCSVEALLEHDEIIQEFKLCNEKLLMRLCKPDAVRVFIEHATRDPPQNASEPRCYRCPFVATELIAIGNPRFLKTFFYPENEYLLDELWGFMDVQPACDMNLVLAGYFSRVIALLFEKYPVEISAYLRKGNADGVLEAILERLHSRSIAELLIRLLCSEQSTLPTEKIVCRLLARLEYRGSMMIDVYDNVVLVLFELLCQKNSVVFHEDLLKQLVDPETVTQLLDHIFCERPVNISAAAAILASVVLHACILQQPPHALSRSTKTKSSIVRSDDEDDVVCIGDEFLKDDRIVGAGDAEDASVSPHGQALICQICMHFQRFRAALDSAVNSSKTIDMPLGTIPAVEITTLEVVGLLTMLIQTGSSEVFFALLEDQVLSKCFEVFFNHPWSSLLHNSVKALFIVLVEGRVALEGGNDLSSLWTRLIEQLLWERGLVERIIAEYKCEQAYIAGPKRRPPRVGYMGHLHIMCSVICELGHRIPDCGARLSSADGWFDIVFPSVEAVLRIHKECLGGNVSEVGGQMTPVSDFLDAGAPLDDIQEISPDNARGMLGAASVSESHVSDVNHDSSSQNDIPGYGCGVEHLFCIENELSVQVASAIPEV